ncbi:DUF1707 domain-containing protein [Kribbella sandramycini]|uniref:DUF1707 domain-containing protein n=1 Tax=Kribbella sandramycini TaxID=60450 RepID=A0A7Y4KU69_9ACTN|nr:DUF1707 domain-containing protein [Kribbella sandramycini]MBB6568704.1 hypothetical protein [Kribbella sandramycini]NOL38713.1 DUF1707 domain-containing protein [Kribbella sandramycini]
MSLEQPPPGQRASDKDREQAATLLQEAHTDGRLDFQELDERLTQVYAAKTQLELRTATADLVPVRSRTAPAEVSIRATHSSQKREGAWQVPERVSAELTHSSARLDFTDAVVHSPEVTVSAALTHSSITMIVPVGWSVSLDEVELHGGSANNRTVGATTNGVHLIVQGTAKYSSVTVRHPRKRHWWWPFYRK